jgi:hypothetical protein
VTLDRPFGEIESEQDGSDALEDLDMVFMGAFEARHGDWGFLLDLLYVDLSDNKAMPLDFAFRDAELETRATAFSGYALYCAAELPQVTVDVGVGFRSFSVSLDALLNADHASANRSYEADETWAVPLVAGSYRSTTNGL